MSFAVPAAERDANERRDRAIARYPSARLAEFGASRPVKWLCISGLLHQVLPLRAPLATIGQPSHIGSPAYGLGPLPVHCLDYLA